MNELRFEVYSGGVVYVDLERCSGCATKVCIDVCQTQGGPLVLDEGGVPTLRWSREELKRGGCPECLGCELDCRVRGEGAVTITLPLAEFDDYLRSLEAAVVYQEAGNR